MTQPPSRRTPAAAEQIVGDAARRGLGGRPRLRLFAAVLWSGFLGACLALAAWLAMPAEWIASSAITFQRLTAVFLIAWALACVPALCAALLAAPRSPSPLTGSAPLAPLSPPAGEGKKTR